MNSHVSFTDLLTWNSIVPYLLLMVLFIVVKSVRFILYANTILKESGSRINYSLLSPNYKGLFQWTATHQNRVGIILFILVLMGIIWAIKFNSH